MSNIQYFKYLESQLAYDGNVHVKSNPSISMANATFNNNKNFFDCKLD